MLLTAVKAIVIALLVFVLINFSFKIFKLYLSYRKKKKGSDFDIDLSDIPIKEELPKEKAPDWANIRYIKLPESYLVMDEIDKPTIPDSKAQLAVAEAEEYGYYFFTKLSNTALAKKLKLKSPYYVSKYFNGKDMPSEKVAEISKKLHKLLKGGIHLA